MEGLHAVFFQMMNRDKSPTSGPDIVTLIGTVGSNVPNLINT